MRASEVIEALQTIMAQQGCDPICCRETGFLGPKVIVSVLLEPHMLEGTRIVLAAKIDPAPPFIVIF